MACQSLAVVLLTLLIVQSSLAVNTLDLIDKDTTKLVLVLASQRAGADLPHARCFMACYNDQYTLSYTTVTWLLSAYRLRARTSLATHQTCFPDNR